MFQTQDVVHSGVQLSARVHQLLVSHRSNSGLKNHRSSFVIEQRPILEWESASNAAKYILALARHKEFIMDSFVNNFVNLLNSSQHPESSGDYMLNTFGGGLKSEIKVGNITSEVSGFVRLPEKVIDVLNSKFTLNESAYYGLREGQAFYQVSETPKTEGSILARAYAQARETALMNGGYWLNHGITVHNASDVRRHGFEVEESDAVYVSIANVISLARFVWAVEAVKPTRQLLLEAKNNVIQQDNRASLLLERERKNISNQNFTKYWADMKSRLELFVKKDEVVASFNEIPLLPTGTRSSRTWGIEVEVVQAHLTSNPRGWDERSDGSLTSYDESCCDCGCDDCDDGSHCGYDECSGDDSDTAEFVSPILRSFNSAGLRHLCNDLDGSGVNSTPGIHIHVGADNLTMPDFARLVASYSAISPFIWPIMDRDTRNYCRDITTQNVAYWLAKARDWTRQGLASTVQHDYQLNSMLQTAIMEQPDDRYHDLNLQAFRQHGTVEFRAMGPVYNYEKLVRWAWMCRELVNVSKLNLPQDTWTNVRSMKDIVSLLRKYGSEQLPANVTKLYESGDEMPVESDEESNN